jgi:HlyD family secretion protein
MRFAAPRTGLVCLGIVVAALCASAGCTRSEPEGAQGYVEGEFVYVASPLPGALEALHVQRGAQVQGGDPLFTLDSVSERAARDEAERRLAEARANLEDAQKGKRPSEIASLEAQLKQGRVTLAQSEKEYLRQKKLFPDGTPEQDLDRSRFTRDEARQRVAQLEADLETARLGSRPDQIAAAEANVRAQEAALVKAEWNLSQKRQRAPQAGLIFETLYRAGEWVAAGRPVVALLPPQNIKVRAFVPEPQIGLLHPGDPVRVTMDGVGEPFMGTISFISPRAEYTPPVIYSRENRSKLVFMVEAVFDPITAAELHPGQPVDVQFGFLP